VNWVKRDSIRAQIKNLHQFLLLSSTERRLLAETTLLLMVIRLALSLLPFQTLRRILTRVTKAPVELREADRLPVDRLAWVVMKASEHVPKSTCLSQALTAQVLLARHKHPAHLRVGFARGEGGRLQGHAWLESQGRVVVGGGELFRYVRLLGME
jgi:hypothetical protein